MKQKSRREPLLKRNGKRAYSWRERLQVICDKFAHLDANGSKIISDQTKMLRHDRLKQCFRELRELGYKLEDPRGLKPKHVQALVQHWEATGKAASTIQNMVSALRTFAVWIGKAGMVKDTASYASSPERVKVTTSATESKAWSDNEVGIAETIANVGARDSRVAMQLRLCLAFGLRRKEAVMLRPHRADKGMYLAVTDGTKGGRDRVVPINSASKRETLDAAKAFVGPVLDAHMGGGQTLKQALNRFSNVLHRSGVNLRMLGVTGHGLRHEYLNGRYEEISGEKSPVRGGARPDKHTEAHARAAVAEEAGHTRSSITSAYTGTHRNLARVKNRRRGA